MWYSNYCSLLGNEVYSNTAASSLYVGQSGDYCVIARQLGPQCRVQRHVHHERLRHRRPRPHRLDHREEQGLLQRQPGSCCADGLTDSVVRNNLGYNQTEGLRPHRPERGRDLRTTTASSTTPCSAIPAATTSYSSTPSTAGLPAGINNVFLNNILYTYNTSPGRGTFCIDTVRGDRASSPTTTSSERLRPRRQRHADGLRRPGSCAGTTCIPKQATDTALFVERGRL